jgi:hypothetical protein
MSSAFFANIVVVCALGNWEKSQFAVEKAISIPFMMCGGMMDVLAKL